MSKVTVRVHESNTQIARLVTQYAQNNAEVRREILNFSRRVHRYWRRIAPMGDITGKRYEENFGGPLPKHWRQTDPSAGDYKAGIHNRRGRKINGFPSRVIAATDYKSHWIEYGTGGDTPTPEFAPRQRTATRFGAVSGVSSFRRQVNKNRKTKVAKATGVVGLDVQTGLAGKPGKARGYDPPESGEDAA